MNAPDINDSERLARLRALIAPVCAAHGVDLVDARFAFDAGRVLRVLIERPEADPAQGAGVTLTECANVSRALSAELDENEAVLPEGAYRLEVGSPGLDRPLVSLRDFERFAGREARVEVAEPIDGRRRFNGTLGGVVGEVIQIEQDGKPVAFPHGQVVQAHLVHRF